MKNSIKSKIQNFDNMKTRKQKENPIDPFPNKKLDFNGKKYLMKSIFEYPIKTPLKNI